MKIELLRMTDLSLVAKGALVRFPKELKRLQELPMPLIQRLSTNVNPEYFFSGYGVH